jgi:uncharacterized protein (DUF488 family)
VRRMVPRKMSPSMNARHARIWTIGHSTRSSGEFFGLLKENRIQALVDVRTFPGSRRYPHFNRENLRSSLAEAEVDYHHMPELGGRRKAKSHSLNMAWRNKSFRGYADYMESSAFQEGIDRLLELARLQRTTIMCAEAVWWRCHRSLIADYLKAAGVTVTHILAAGKSEEHPYTSAAQIVNGKLSYRGVLESSE